MESTLFDFGDLFDTNIQFSTNESDERYQSMDTQQMDSSEPLNIDLLLATITQDEMDPLGYMTQVTHVSI